MEDDVPSIVVPQDERALAILEGFKMCANVRPFCRHHRGLTRPRSHTLAATG